MTAEVVFDRYDAVREAMYHPDLSRGMDPRSAEEGNPRADVLSVLHGDHHKARRRLENPLFRRAALVEYERELFPQVLEDILVRRAVGLVDLFDLGGALSVVLAARRAGIDHDGSDEQLDELFGHVKVIAQASAIMDVVGDRDKVRAEVMAVLEEFDERYVQPSRRRREALLDEAERGGGQPVPHDLLTVALQQRRGGDPTFDDGLLVRETGLYLHGGSHTSAQTMCNAFYYLLGYDGVQRDPSLVERAGKDPLFAQRCVHETLRLRPTTPRIKRVAVADAVVAGVEVPEGARVVLDVVTANRDRELFGAHPEAFDPDRVVREDVAMWGLSFGAGPHICIGRSVAGGFPLHGEATHDEVGEAHLHGLVALMLQAVAARRIARDRQHDPVLDERTNRGTRWLRFPVRFPDDGADPAPTNAAMTASGTTTRSV